MGASHSAEDANAYASDPPASERRKANQKRRRHSVDSVASYSSQNHVDRIRTQNFSAASCHDDDCDFSSIKTSLFRRSSSNLDFSPKRPESVTSNTSSTRSRLRELVERKSSQDDYRSVASAVGDIQYFENPTETLEFDRPRNAHEAKKNTDERPKKRKLTKSKEKEKEKEKELCESKKKHEKYQSKLAEYYKVPVQLPQDEFYQHLTRSKAAEELLQKRFSNSDTEFNGSYGRLCKHKEPEGSNLRRSRSLAVIREETFTDLQIQNHAKNKRSQLIPRARLFDKPCFKDRLPGRAKYQTKEEVLENIYIDSTASCFGDINAQRESDNRAENAEAKSDKEDAVSRVESNHSRSISGSWPNLTEDIKHTNLSEDSIGHSRNPSEIDSLDSNYVRKHYNFEAHLKGNYKSGTPDSERSIVSPNDSKQLYITTDDLDTESEVRERSKNITPKSYTNDSLSITNSEKEKPQTEGTNDKDYFEEVSLKSPVPEPDKNHIPTVLVNEHKNEGDLQSVVSENDETVSSPESITSYISISIASSTDKSHKLEHLANSLAEKIDEYCESQYLENTSNVSQTVTTQDKNQEPDPIYTRVNKKRTFADIRRDSFQSNKSNTNIFNEVQKKSSSEVYISNTYIESDDYSTQSGQRHCASTKNITTEPFVTTLIENQYYSLPDINISKCLRKSERIDAQLREEDPEDISCENTYEIAHSNFREILTNKSSGNYGQLNQSYVNHNNNNVTSIQTSSIYLPEYSEPEIQNFTKLEDDLKSIITIESSNADDKDINYFRADTHQNEREINEIENTIRNTKVITKSESLKINSCIYKPQVHLSKSRSNDDINLASQKARTGVKKHYSLRQREPADNELDRLPSPSTVVRSISKPIDQSFIKNQNVDDNKAHSLLTRVQSFKTSAESNIAILPLSGHQTIVIDPPLNQNTESKKRVHKDISKQEPVKQPVTPKPCTEIKFHRIQIEEPIDKNKNKHNSVDTSSYYTPKDPFITIKLNKVVKTNLPKLKKAAGDKIASVQYKFEKPPPKLIIKDNDNKKAAEAASQKINSNMTRPQILQVVDSKTRKQSMSSESKPENQTKDIMYPVQLDISQKKEEEGKGEHGVKEKLNNAIKTDIEYQEKLHSVKNYWSKLIDKSPESKENSKPEFTPTKTKTEEIKEREVIYEKNHKDNGTKEDDKPKGGETCVPEISVGNIIKSIESVKIVDSIRKISQSKIQLWKDETEKVKSDSEIEETTVQKIVKDCESNIYDNSQIENARKKEQESWTRDTPEIEIVELSNNDNQNQKTQATLIKAKGFDQGCDEFDHVRYKVMKSELFKNSMIANYRKEAQFDGLLQYLQDYSFQELLVNNNIVIIEPVRTKVEPSPRKNAGTDTCKIAPTLLKRNENAGNLNDKKNAVRRHFFYHPIRVNKEIIEEELPNPDTVKKVRNLFEDTLKMKSPITMSQDPPLIDELGLTRRATSYRNLNEDSKNKVGVRKKVIRQLTIDTSFGNKKWDNASLSSGVSSGDLSSNNEYETDGLSPYSHKNLKENAYSSSDEYLCDSINHDFCCESQYVSPDIMKKIRDCGTSVTYYGGKVLNSKQGSTVSPMTKAIMEEIKGLQKNCSRDCYSCQTKCRGEKCSCLSSDKHKTIVSERQNNSSTSSDSGNQDLQENNKRTEGFPGFKFKLVKSNSCSSRLELTGSDENKGSRLKFRNSQMKTDDPPLVCDDENSVKNKICRLESYNKGIAKTPFENKEKMLSPQTSKVDLKPKESIKKTVIVAPQPSTPVCNKEETVNETPKKGESVDEQTNAAESDDPHSFEKKYYYVNENLDQSKAVTGKFGEMVFEEFEVLESCYDSLNSNKSLK
ncbi:protein javelin [Plutella xylostella]|uniref:protein javelin n=1 Tax=Plutella xylostella TaxID=51655 RepID=UPI0020324CF8|nr:protein javelin [Plutella xylostella]